MSFSRQIKSPLVTAVAAALSVTATLAHSAMVETADNTVLEETIVVSKRTTYSNNQVSDSMQLQYSDMTSVNDLIDDLPGVSVQEGDAFGFDDWSTAIAVRGFQTNLGEQQVGSTIDGLPNGNSNYGGGSKANRYVDTANIGTVEVFQGTADIASRSLEALGGTINYVTSDPMEEQNVRAQFVTGENDALRYYARFDSGLVAGNTRFWVSGSHQEATDWMEGSAENERDHYAFKLISDFDDARVTFYASYDDTHEDNYQRIYSEADFDADPRNDQLIGEWTNTPYINQVYRRGWSTLRKNFFGYGKLDWNASEDLNVVVNGYYHHQTGRGDWLPPYLADVTLDNGGPESELNTNTVLGGPFYGIINFVDPNGVALTPAEGCVSSLTFPYGGAGAAYDPACYPADAVPVQSFRNTQYEKERLGLTADATWTMGDNEVRAGIWYEDQTREESRAWRKVIDARVGMAYEQQPYWMQYSREYPQTVFKWYVEDSLTVGALTFNVGAKQFLVEVERNDLFDASPYAKLDSDSDVLLSGGVVWQTPVDGLEVFGGYAENFKSISDNILERPSADLGAIEPETSDNVEAGLRYTGENLYLTATYFDSTFDNRIIFLAPGSAAGNDYLIGTDGTYINAGGIDSSGLEVAATYNVTNNISLYAAYTLLDATYQGTGNPVLDGEAGIYAGNDVTGIPESMLVVSADYSNDMFSAGVSAKQTGDRAVNTTNTWYADSYVLVDAYLSIRGESIASSLAGLTIDAQVKNLADEEYISVISSNAGWLGAPRTATIGFTYDF